VLFFYVVVIESVLLKQRIYVGNDIRFSQVFVSNSRSNKSILSLIPCLKYCLYSVAFEVKVEL
jgi:hypothetical protein